MDMAAAFLKQARSDFAVFELLWATDSSDVPVCHALQHLQMATEKMSKSILFPDLTDDSSELRSHAVFHQIVPVLQRRDVARKLGYENPAQFKALIDRTRSWFRKVEQLSPSIGTQAETDFVTGSNVEYPWRRRNQVGVETWETPVEHNFDMSTNLRTHDGHAFIKLVGTLLDRSPSILS